MWRAGAGHGVELDRERSDVRAARRLGRLEGRTAQRQHDHGLVRKCEVHRDLAAVAAAGRDGLSTVECEPEDVGGEARAEPRGDRRPEGHAGSSVSDQHQPDLPRLGDGAHRLLIERGIEMRVGLRDGHDLVDSLKVGDCGKRVRILTDDEDGERAAEAVLDLGCGADHLQRDVAQETVEVLGDDEGPGHHTSPRLSRIISAMALATAAASPSIIAARPDLGGS